MESLDRPNRICGAGQNGTVDHGEVAWGELDAEEYWPGRGHEPTSSSVGSVNIVIDPAQVRIAVRDRTIVALGGLFYPSDPTSSLTN